MTQPRVCAVMLVDGRPDMVKRAIRSFEAQAYENRDLIVFDTGQEPLTWTPQSYVHWRQCGRATYDTIGSLRNRANELTSGADIIVHWDSDDWSAPERIAEQVALLTNPTRWQTALQVVGYSDMLFLDTRTNEAWLYTGAPRYLCGTSLCYWRDTWKRKPFPAKNSGEDLEWQGGLQSLSVSSRPVSIVNLAEVRNERPRMICSIHGGNTASHVDQRSTQWRRVPEWDAYCRGVMA